MAFGAGSAQIMIIAVLMARKAWLAPRKAEVMSRVAIIAIGVLVLFHLMQGGKGPWVACATCRERSVCIEIVVAVA